MSFLSITHEEAFDGEPDFYQMLDLKDKNERMRKALKAVLPYLPSTEQTEIVYQALGEERPPLRKLK